MPYQIQLLYKTCKACLTDHIGFILCHIMSQVLNSLDYGHTGTGTDTQTQKHTHTQVVDKIWFNKLLSYSVTFHQNLIMHVV